MEERPRLEEEDGDPGIPECYKQEWKGRLSRRITSKDDILSLTRSTKYRFFFHISGFVDCKSGSAGYGAILRDYHGNPLTARCGVLSQSDKRKCATPFYTELKGVSTALKMALDYQVHDIVILPTNYSVAQFFTQACRYTYLWGRDINSVGNPDSFDGCMECAGNFPCKEYVMMKLHPDNKNDIDEIYNLTIDMVSDFLNIKRQGLVCFFVDALTYQQENKAAQWLVKCRINKDMMPSDLFRYEELADMLLNNKLCEGFLVDPQRGGEADPFPMDPAVHPYLCLGSFM